MLRIVVDGKELWNEATSEFIQCKEQVLQLEHSLVSISKWEAKFHKPFLSDTDKTYEETIAYIKMMTITQNVDPNVYYCLSSDNIRAINSYIDDPMTATTISDHKNGGRRDIVTSELIYYWMVALNIPFECQKWHLSRLLTLIRVCEIKSRPPKKMSQQSIMRQNSSLNKARRARHHSRG